MHTQVSKYLIIGLAAFAIVGIGLATFSSAQQIFIRAESKFNPLEQPQVSATDETSTISWKSRNKTLSLVKYGNSPTSLTVPAFDTSDTADHKITIVNLVPSTTYYYRIFTDNFSYPAEPEAPLTFTTLPSSHAAVAYPPCLQTVFESYYVTHPGDGKFNSDYDVYPPGQPDGAITFQDYLQCIRASVSPTP